MYMKHLGSGERQAPIDGWTGYFITDRGRVFSYKKQGFQRSFLDMTVAPRQLTVFTGKTGEGGRRICQLVALREGNKRRRVYELSQVLAVAFIGPRPDGCVVRHLNDNTMDNGLENLAYGTHVKNAEDARRNGKAKPRRFTDEQAMAIRADPRTVRDIAAAYSVPRAHIESVKTGRIYAYVGGTLVYNYAINRRPVRKEGVDMEAFRRDRRDRRLRARKARRKPHDCDITPVMG